VEVEYFFNGAGESSDLDASLFRFRTGASLQMSRHLAGLLMSYEFLPILIGQVVVLYSWSDSSSQVQPILTWNITDNTDLLIGASVNSGDRPDNDPVTGVKIDSEFGTFPDLYFAQFKIYF
jgi:hypothetical protein